jgi:hypothetical protein
MGRQVYLIHKSRKACGSKEFDLPLFRFPLRGQTGAGGFPPRRKHVARQQKALASTDAAGSPHKRGCRPLVDPPLALGTFQNPDSEDSATKRIKEGRHVGLDFYDLLIEALKSPVTESISVMGIFRQLPYPFSLATV